MTNSPLSIKADRVLFGRDKTLISLEQAISQEKSRILLTGPSGIGKSELLRELAASMTLVHGEICLRYEIRSAAHSVEDMLSNLAIQLLNQAKIEAREGFIEGLSEISTQESWSLGTAALLDTVSILAPKLKNTSEALLKSFESRSSRATAEQLARAGRDDLLAGFIRLVELLALRGICGSILIDRLEGGSQAVQEAALALALSLPPSWATIFAINDETPEGLKTLDRVKPEMSYRGGDIMPLGPLDLAALEAWTKSVQLKPGNINELVIVLENCGGRPLFLKDWVNGLITIEETSLILGNRLGNYYEARIKALSRDARWLLVRLAILPEHSRFSFEFCHALLEVKSASQSTDATWQILSELKDKNFVEPLHEEFRIVHAITRNHIFSTLPETVLKAAASDLIGIILRVPLQADDAYQSYVKLVVSSLAQDRESVLRLALPTARKLSFAGSYRPALSAYRLGLTAGEAAANLEVLVESTIGMATVLLNTGYYQDALDHLSTLSWDVPDGIRAKIALTRGEILMRLNRYEESMLELQQAHERYTILEDVQGQLGAEKIRNTILRDLGKYDEAVELATSIVERAEKRLEPSTLLARCFQSLARSLAFRSDASAGIAAAQRALDISLAIHSIRSEGNSYLALGEVYRHHVELDEAIGNYEKAIRIAESIANRDSLLWSCLGLADALLLKEDQLLATRVLGQVGDIVRNAAVYYPLEHLHWQLSVATIDYLNGNASSEALQASARNYESLGITWPQGYVYSVISSGKATVAKDM